EKIVSLVSRIRQTLFFSATMPREIRRLADAFLSNPKQITVSPPSTPAETMNQSLVMVSIPRGSKPGGGQKEKRAALRRSLETEDVKNALVFCNRKRDVGIVHRSLARHGFDAGQLHGDMAQSARTETLGAFKRGEIRLLVCSDVAARGLDIQDMSHVFNFDVPSHAEDYVHRIGRTGRAGKKGRAVTIATSEDRKYLAAIAKLIGKPIPPAEQKPPKDEAVPEEAQADKSTAGTPESEDPKESRRRRSRGKKRPDGAAKDRARTSAKDTAKEPKRGKKAERGKKDEPKEPVRGMGDHVPAFMMRSAYDSPAPPKRKRSAKKD
ncbi:MAG: DEAD/DEAH box helicase, partial [Rhodospirillales bacterium]|nr:DEAD/DEAH box helicase [Rhodospirillales bacterium]